MRPGLPLVLLALSAVPALAAEPAPIRIGLSAPLTGTDAAFGQGLRLGAEQAVADLNRAGGIAGRKLALVAADDAGDGRQGVAVARKFAADGIALVVGPPNSLVASLAGPVYDEAGIAAVLPGPTANSLTARGFRTLFRLGVSDARQAEAAAAHLAERHAGRRIGIVHDKTTFGRGLADAVARVLRGRGEREVAFLALPSGAKDAGETVAALKEARIEAVYFGGLAREGGLLAKGLREAGLDAALVGSDGLLDKEFAQIAGSAAEGTVMTVPGEPRRLPEARGADPRGRLPPRTAEAESTAGAGYAAVEVLARGIERAKSAEGRKVAAALHDGAPLRTASSEVAFDARGDLLKPDLAVRIWRRNADGRIDYAGNEAAGSASP